MQLYKNRIYPHQVLPLNGTFEEFLEEWLELRKDKQRDLRKMFHLCKPFLDEWELELGTVRDFPNCQMQFTIMRLDLIDDPRSMIKNWIQKIENSGGTLRDELEFLFIEFMRRDFKPFRVPAVSARSHAIAFVIVFRDTLCNAIKRAYSSVDYIPLVNIEEYTKPWNDNDLDMILVRAMGLTAWDSYIMEMYLRGYDRNRMMEFTHYSQYIIRQEIQTAWKRLNTI